MSDDVPSPVGRALLWGGLNTVLSRVVNLAMTAVVVHIVTPDEFGTFAVALTVFTVISGFSELGLAAVMARRDLDPARIGPTATALGNLAGLVLAVAMFASAGPVAAALGAPDAADPLRVLSITVLLIGVVSVPVGLIVRDYQQGHLLIATLVSFVPSNVVLVVMALDGQGAMAFAWSRVVGQVVMGALLVYAAGKYYRPRLDPAQIRLVAAFAFSVGGANLVRYVLLNADYLLIGRILGPAAVGVYVLAFNVGSWATSVLSGMINSVALPAMSQESGDATRLTDVYRSAVLLVCLFGFPISGLTAVLAEPIVRVLYGEQWLEAAPLLVVLTIYGSLFALSLVLGNVLMATGRAGTLLVLQLTWLVLLAPAMLIGLSISGLRGAADAHVVVIVFLMIPLHVLLVRKELPGAIRILVATAAPPGAMTGLACACAWLAQAPFEAAVTRLVTGGVAGSAVYLVLALPLLRPLLPARVITLCAPVLRLYDLSFGRLLNERLAPCAGRPGGSASVRG